MKTQNKTTIVTAIAALAMIGTSSAAIIFNATPSNTTLGNNGIGVQGTLTGTVGNLDFQNNGENFNFSAFYSTDDVNTLNGGAITASDTITVTVTVSGLSVGVLRANGIDFGLNNEITPTAISNNEVGDNVIRMEASNAGGDIINFYNGGNTDSGLTATTAELTNGFTATLVADVNGYTYTLDSVGDTSPITVSGTFSGTEFVDTVGSAHFFYAQQQFNSTSNGVDLLAHITEASISVDPIPEPSSVALLGLGGLALIMRRRK